MIKKSLILATLFFVSIGIGFGQPTRTPKMFPKFTSLTTNVKETDNRQMRVEPLQQPEFARDSEMQSSEKINQVKKTSNSEAESIQWITFEEAIAKQKTEKRKIFMDVYTEWCGWCKRMDETTFSDPSVIKEVNKNFYAVKFDAEQKEEIVFKDVSYKFVSQGRRGYHELAQKLLNGRMGYPTSVFLNEDMDVIQPIPGYLDAEKLDVILHYFGTDSYQKLPWETYEKEYPKRKAKGK